MGLIESKGNMYSWVTHTWNTIKGECPHGCTYCYMKRYGKQKPVRFDESELKTDLGQDNFIFVGSSCDMFAYEIPEKWIHDTLAYCREFDNTYLFQTKNPRRLIKYLIEFLNNSRICTTIETNRFHIPEMGDTPGTEYRATAMKEISKLGFKIYVTIEPIMDFDLAELVTLIKLCEPEQVNIGADSGNNNLPEPPKEKILELMYELKKFTVIDQKNNLARLLK